MSRRTSLFGLAGVLLMAGVCATSAAAQSSSPHQVLINTAAVSETNVLFVSGANFGNNPQVFLAGTRLEVLTVSADGALLSARIPGWRPGGSYLLHISTGNGATRNATFAVTIGY